MSDNQMNPALEATLVKAKGLLSQPKKVISLLAVVLVIGGVAYGKHAINISAQDTIDDFIISKKLSSIVSYETVSASFLGEVTINEVEFRVPGVGSIPVPKIVLSNINNDDDMLLSFKLTLPSFEFSVKDMSSKFLKGSALSEQRPSRIYSNTNPLNDFFADMLALGLDTISGSYSLSYEYNPKRRTLDLAVDQKIDQLGSADVSLGVAGLDLKYIFGSSREGNILGNTIVSVLLHGFDGASLADPAQSLISAADDLFSPVSLSNLSVSIDNDAYRKLKDKYPDTALPKTDKKRGTSNQYSEFEPLVLAGMPSSEAKKIVESYKDWLENGGKLKIQSNLKKPLPLFQNTVRNPNFKDFFEFFAAAKFSIDN